MQLRQHWDGPAESATVGELRRSVTEFAAAVGMAGAALGDVRSCVSEAATNAVMHAFRDGRAAGTIRVVAEVLDDELVVTLGDDGMGFQPRSDSPGLGVGLPTIEALSRSMTVGESDGGGTEVRMTFTLTERRLELAGSGAA